jgi:hypothetical protein
VSPPLRRRRHRATKAPVLRLTLGTLFLSSVLLFICSTPGSPLLPSAVAIPPCKAGEVGWCLARRIAGDVPNGELGFRFGEPLDVDGDGKADVAAGSRFKLQKGTLQNGNVTVWSGAGGARIRSWDGDFADGLFGHWVLPVPDLGSDGLADLVIAAPTARVDGVGRGIVVARSPKNGDEMWRRSGAAEENFGWDLAIAGDHDGDGRSEIFVGAPARDAGRVYLVGGRDGTLIRTYAPPTDVPTFGWFVARADDLDRQGRADLVVGAQLEKDAKGAMVGAAHVFSSESGKEIFHWQGVDHLSGFGEVVAAVSDLDADGKGEIVVAAPRTNDRTHSHPGDVLIYSGATGRQLRHWTGAQAGEIYGRMVVAVGDLDGDGVEDLAIGAPWHRREQSERVGRLELRSGKTGTVLAELVGDEADCWFGWHVRTAPDPDGLGRPTLLVASLRHPVGDMPSVGVLDLLALQSEQARSDQGTIKRGERRSDIK